MSRTRVVCPKCGVGGANDGPCFCHKCEGKTVMLPAINDTITCEWPKDDVTKLIERHKGTTTQQLANAFGIPKLLLGIDPAKPGADKTVHGNWPKTNANPMFDKALLDRSVKTVEEFNDLHMCNFRDPVWGEIIDAAHDMDKNGQSLSHFIVGGGALDRLKDKAGMGRNVERNSIIGYRVVESKLIPADELWGMSSDNDILFKIKMSKRNRKNRWS